MEWLILSSGAFLAGLIDAVVGGGGLVQVPLLLTVLPNVAIPILFGTNKISSVAGTASAAWQFARKVEISRQIAYPAAGFALFGSALGAAAVSFFPANATKPLVLVLLVVVGAYTFLKPGFGQLHAERINHRLDKTKAGCFGAGIGFYDGFFGPGAGSFLVFGFVRIFGMDMLRATATAKIVNVATNMAAIVYFVSHAGVLWKLGAGMAVANVAGAQLGARLAVRHGNGFIRGLLLVVVSGLIAKLSWDLFSGR